MARPVTIKTETILEAAREVFLAHGIQATTAEIAARAGVSEGSIFNRFKSKRELFQAAFEVGDFNPPWQTALAGRVGKGDFAHTLFELGVEMVGFFGKLIPMLMMYEANPAEHHSGQRKFPKHDSAPARAIKRLTAYFAAEIHARGLRHHDPEIVARTFMGGLWQHAYFSGILLPKDELPLPAEQYVRGLVHLLLQGMTPLHDAHSKEPRS